jgi:hypothetical protein
VGTARRGVTKTMPSKPPIGPGLNRTSTIAAAAPSRLPRRYHPSPDARHPSDANHPPSVSHRSNVRFQTSGWAGPGPRNDTTTPPEVELNASDFVAPGGKGMSVGAFPRDGPSEFVGKNT